MLRYDLKVAIRFLLKSPGVAAAALLSLGMGIGVSSAVFSVIEALLIKPLPFAAQEELVYATEVTGPGRALNAISGPDLADWRAGSRSFAQLAGYRRSALTLTGLGPAERLDVAAVESGIFTALRVSPQLGRALLAADDAPGVPRVCVVSEHFWRSRLGADASALGRTLTMDGQPFTVVGVMPPSFRFPLEGTAVELWTQPRAVPFGNLLDVRALFFFQAVGRLRPGATLEQGRAELSAVTSAIAAANPESHPQRGVLVAPLREQLVGKDRGALLVLLGAVGLLLLIACANVGSLLLARALARRHELAVRAALGASRGRLLRQLLTESLLLGAAGGCLGVAVCALAIDAVEALLPPEIPRLRPIVVDGGVVAFAAVISILSSAAFGAGPALLLSRASAQEALRTGPGGAARGLRLRGALVVGEVALALSLSIGATLMARSLRSAQHVDPGFSPAGLQSIDLTLPDKRYPPEAQSRFAEALLRGAGSIPGVSVVGFASPLPVGGRAMGLTVAPRDRAEPHPPQSSFASMSPGAFALLGIALDHGREFTAQDRDGSPP